MVPRLPTQGTVETPSQHWLTRGATEAKMRTFNCENWGKPSGIAKKKKKSSQANWGKIFANSYKALKTGEIKLRGTTEE